MNPLVPIAPFLYPLKTSENLTVFQGVERGCIGSEWVKEIRKNKERAFKILYGDFDYESLLK